MNERTKFPIQTTTEYFQSNSGMPIAVRVAHVLAPIIEQRLRAIEAVAAEEQLPIHHSFNAPLFAGTMTIPAQERDWLLMPLAEDPAWNHKHGYPLPKETMSVLRKIEAAGLDFDTIYVAHEVPKVAGYLPAPTDKAALLTPPVSAKAQRSATLMGATAANLVKAAFSPVLLAGVVGAAATVAASSLAGLDPILFGIITDPRSGLKPGATAAWVYLCHWDWS